MSNRGRAEPFGLHRPNLLPGNIVDPWTSRTKFDSDLSVSGRPGGGRDRADYSGEDRQHQQSSHGTVSMSVNTINAIRLE